MYLKSIEMQGFKSFAGKMTLEFHEGVTAIVGPNGSGKSNVADAVRWVLGEQSAKQLRGGNMQDVIFAGTESRKQLGFASVAITLDNSDHQLNIEYPEVTVMRRLYRSGESEYKINGSACRLRDIQELFYDTGIGKEGYSMIGQGQIDKILSGKPEERRELFDEAAGIVKYKRRKLETLKKLEKEEGSLARVTDILTELTRQVVPLEKQAEKAKIYLQKRDALKERDTAVFLLNEEKTDAELKELRKNASAAKEELAEANEQYEKAKEQFAEQEQQITETDQAIAALHEKRNEAKAQQQSARTQIQLLEQRLENVRSNRTMFEEQEKGYRADAERRKGTLQEYEQENAALDQQLQLLTEKTKEAERKLEEARKALADKSSEIEQDQQELLALLEARSGIREENQRFVTLKEQIAVRQSDLTARMLRLTDDKKRIRENEEVFRKRYQEICTALEEKNKRSTQIQASLADIKVQLTNTDASRSQILTAYHKERSLLESLMNLAERYEGYGNSVRRVMEQKQRNPGIMGVVAELISTKQEYETAIETALGGSLQNIVTDNEATAKYLIEFLKRGHYGRATFLPMTVVNEKNAPLQPLEELGVIGVASELVEYEPQFQGIVRRLLGRTYVIDTIDHAIAIGRRYGHKHRMVTLEGELISPGGSLTGGSYKNNANLMGRQRQIEELKDSVKKNRRRLEEKDSRISELKENRNLLRDEQGTVGEELRQLLLDKNTAEVNLKAAVEQTDSILRDNEQLDRENRELHSQRAQIEQSMKGSSAQMDASALREEEIKAKIQEDTKIQETLSGQEHEAQEAVQSVQMEAGEAMQKKTFLQQNMQSTAQELERIRQEIEATQERLKKDESLCAGTGEEMQQARQEEDAAREQAEELSKQLDAENRKKETLNNTYRATSRKREELAEKRGLLDTEIYRLDAAIEKHEEEREKNVTYLWEEYQLTPAQITADPEDTRSRTQLLQEISELKKEIRGLGNVNVNAIEEFKEIKERHDFLQTQYDDIVKAAENLKSIIAELDKGMHERFTKGFADIRQEFDKVFKKLFGGGHGMLELVEGEDILEAGVRIIAQPPGKKVQNMMQLSGGEKTLTAIALLFAIQNLKPSPFCLLDEIEAALDDANVDRFAKYLHLLKGTQFIVITHRRGTMVSADRLYGITMQEKGISTMVSVDLIESQLS